MPGFDGTGPRGMGPMTGGGRGFCAIPLHSGWPLYARTGFHMPYAVPWGMPYYGTSPFAPGMTREQELRFLKAEAQVLRNELKELETRIKQLSAKNE